VPPAEAKTDGKAVASLVLGVFSVTVFSVLAGIPAVILGHVSRSNIKKSMGRLRGEGLALAGLIMGYISFAAIPFFLIVAAIAIPNLLRARTAANEASAVGGIRTINTALVTYAAEHPKAGFPQTLQELTPENSSSALLGDSFAAPARHGYRFAYRVSSSGGMSTNHYFVTATPVAESTGHRTFCADETGVIRFAQQNEPCTLESPLLQ
jgi:type II secretory pathway pseudopilin PulG